MAKKSKLYVSFVLDETGSMAGVAAQTISGFNEYIETLKKDSSSAAAVFTLTQFNSEHTAVVYSNVPLSEVKPLSRETYQPNGLTPLYDAIGATIRALDTQIGKTKATALVVIQTDGEENHSKEYTRQSIFSLIDEKKNLGWTFVFLGADQDAWLTSQALGIARGNTVSYDSKMTDITFRAVATATVSYARSGGSQTSTLMDDATKKVGK